MKNQNLQLDIGASIQLQSTLIFGQTQVQVDRAILIAKVFPHGAVELENKEGTKFTVNGKRIKIYLGHAESVHEVVEPYHLDEV